MSEVMYYECHITVEPCFDEKLETFKKVSSKYNFRVADLLMQKDRDAQAERSNKDSFCTGRANAKNLDDMLDRMDCLIDHLIVENIKVWRAKIEAVIFDQRFV